MLLASSALLFEDLNRIFTWLQINTSMEQSANCLDGIHAIIHSPGFALQKTATSVDCSLGQNGMSIVTGTSF